MKNVIYTVAALSLLASGGAFAQQTLLSNINVTAEVTAACTDLTTTDADFGQASQTDTDTNATATITVTCATGTAYTVEIDYGFAPQGTGPFIRTVTGANPSNGEQMDYYIYQDAARTIPWGEATQGEEFTGTGTGAADPLTAYFTLDRNSGASPGSYSDLVTVSLIF